MRLTELLKTDQVTISCELFPPKQGAQLANYKNIVADMAALKPAYMSVTYGATGSCFPTSYISDSPPCSMQSRRERSARRETGGKHEGPL